MPSQQDRDKAAAIVRDYRSVIEDGADELTDTIATALEQRGAEEREVAARKCDNEVLRMKAIPRRTDYADGRLEAAMELATAIRETGES